MPDENSTPVWTSQIPQDNQAITNQAWDDFVLDFWENDSNESVWIQKIEINNLEDKTSNDEKDTQISVDLNFDDENIFSGESEKGEREDDWTSIDFQEENTENENNFDISLNENSWDEPDEFSDENWQNYEEWLKFVDNDETENKNIDIEDIDGEDAENGVNLRNGENQENLENDEENLDVDDLSYTKDESIDQGDEIDEEENEEHTESEDMDYIDEEEESQIEPDNSNLDNEESVSGINQPDVGEKIEYREEKDDVDSSSQGFIDFSEDAETQSNEENKELSEGLGDGESSESSDNEEESNMQEESLQETNLLENTEENTIEDNNSADLFKEIDGGFLTGWATESISREISSKEDENNENINININNPEDDESQNQPEITDLLWNTSEKSSDINMEEDTDTIITNFELNENPVDKQENDISAPDTLDWEYSSNQTVQEDTIEDKKLEEQSFILDYQEDDKSKDDTNHTMLDNNTLWNNTENWSEADQSDINSINTIASSYIDKWNINIERESEVNNTKNADLWNQNVIQSTSIDTNNDTMNQAETHQITSTLSLDQILDSELNDNPQFSDNSTSVPRNVPLNSWSVIKKVWILAWIGVFVLAGYFLFLKSPNINTEESHPEATEFVEDYEDDTINHPSAPEDVSEPTEDLTDTDFHPAKSTIEQESSDEDRGDENWENSDPEDLDVWKPEPYVCEDWYCMEEPEFPEAEPSQEYQPWDVLEIISNYKLEAESYYSQSDENQDKKLAKLSLQVIYLCDVYKEQIENGEWLDDESFSSFKSKIDWLFAKIEEYRSWNTMDESDKEELKEFIYQRANW